MAAAAEVYGRTLNRAATEHRAPEQMTPPRRRRKRELDELTGVLATAVAAGTPAARDDVSEECKRLLEVVRQKCPGLLDVPALRPGEVGPEVPLDREAGASLFRLVARQIVGVGDAVPAGEGVVVWTQGNDELAVVIDKVSLETAEGAIAVDIPVSCDEVGSTVVRVRFALGSDARPAGLIATTDERPFGPPEIIDVWGEALTAFAWQIVLTATTKLADATGRDSDGAGLIPVGLRGTPGGISVLTLARHMFDRRQT